MFGKNREVDASSLIEKTKFKATIEMIASLVEKLEETDASSSAKVEKLVATISEKVSQLDTLVDNELIVDAESFDFEVSEEDEE